MKSVVYWAVSQVSGGLVEVGSWITKIVCYRQPHNRPWSWVCLSGLPSLTISKTPAQLEPSFFLMSLGKRNTVSALKAETICCPTHCFWFCGGRKQRKMRGASFRSLVCPGHGGVSCESQSLMCTCSCCCCPGQCRHHDSETENCRFPSGQSLHQRLPSVLPYHPYSGKR